MEFWNYERLPTPSFKIPHWQLLRNETRTKHRYEEACLLLLIASGEVCYIKQVDIPEVGYTIPILSVPEAFPCFSFLLQNLFRGLGIRIPRLYLFLWVIFLNFPCEASRLGTIKSKPLN